MRRALLSDPRKFRTKCTEGFNFCRAIERKKYNPAITIHPTSIYAEFNNDCDCVMLSISACSTKGMDKVNA